jgi:hypothetical protein
MAAAALVVNGRSTQADLGKDALACEQLGRQTNHEAEHRQATIPGFGESHETEAGRGVSHGAFRGVLQTVTECEASWPVRLPDPGNGRSPSAARCSKSAASKVVGIKLAMELEWIYVANFL